MSLAIWTNNASSTLASGINNAVTSLTVQAGQGALFPAPTAGQYAMITLEDVSGNIEITKCTGRTGDTLTIVRAQEGTAALAFSSGSRVENRITAGMLMNFLQHTGDTLADTTISGIVTMGAGGSIRGGETVGTFIRGAAGDTSNQFFVPSGGASPTIGGSVVLTTANVIANLPAGAGFNLTGMVQYWNGTSGTIPAGYHACDGTAGTPDLRDTFILGAGPINAYNSTGGSSVTTTGTTSALASTNTSAYVLTLADIPAHHHTVFGLDTTYSNGGGHLNSVNGSSGSSFNTSDVGGGGGHVHAVGSSAHSHTYTLPPYRALFAIMKT